MTPEEERFRTEQQTLYAAWPVYRTYKSRPKMSLIKALKSNTFAIIIAILSVLVQSFHSFSVFYRVSSLNGSAWGIAQAVLFAVIIDLAILFYTVRKNVKVTWMAGFIMVLINCYYYYSHLGLSFDLILGGLLSLVIPVSVYYYSEEIHEEDNHVVESVKSATEIVLKAMDTVKALRDDQQTNDIDVEKPVISKDFVDDKSLLNVRPIPSTDRPNR